MKIIFSPTKRMKIQDDLFSNQKPFFLKEANELLAQMKTYSEDQRRKIFNTSEGLFQKVNQTLLDTESMMGRTPSLFAYQGLAFQHLSANALGQEELAYLEENLRILSAMYGVLKPKDAVVPYRLEMKTTLPLGSLYAYWQNKLKDYFQKEEIINVASKEYSDVLLKAYLGKVTHIIFGHLSDGKLKTKGTLAKIARGDLVYSMAERKVTSVNELRVDFDRYRYREDLSDQDHIVYLYG